MRKKSIIFLIFMLTITTILVPITTSFQLENTINSEPLNNPPNDPPTMPVFDNPPKARVNTEYEFYLSSADPNYDQIYFQINYFDGTITDWIGPFGYNAHVKFTHVYTEEGGYQIAAKAKDDPNMDGDLSDGKESPQGNSHVTVYRSRSKYDMILFKIFDRVPLLKQLF